ncbi:MAG: branched-chain amino acid ABC transporter permease [Rhodospirillaceae bacterium]|jgi:branched-chain amino acid transport system permease protein|nr:branched-chain amino acid ABC transporter permease [Rhodospirillaceae bacterium]MBT6407144.1 branched-chain amino acid ABC transporter permease [Rhodospirillaceae bacterium]MBT7759041.1 branched-chain amino acid ABC transporter permease [Rhodospirillaceae bacterium]MBT7975011.1 branched-chain amino acid ABC transporter permease [Rhodospirillaceae bacterium]
MSDAANNIIKPARRPLRVIPIVEVILLILLIAVPFFVSDFLTIIVTRMIILGMLAISFDLCWGYSGIMTFGQALFFGMSGYVVALLANKAGFLQLWWVVPIGMLVGLVVSFLIAWFLLLGKRRPEIIFVALGTLTASYAAERLVAGWQWVGAGNGMSIFDFLLIGDYELEPGIVFYYIAAVILVVVYLASRYLVRSQFGLVLAGMRQNEQRLAFFGYRIQVFKALVFSFAGMIAGLSGALYTYHEGFVGPGSMGMALSTYAVLYGLFGGTGTLLGPLIGVVAIESISFVLSDLDEVKSFWPIILGVIMLIVVAYKPTGLMGFLVSQRERIGTFGVAESKRGKAANDDKGGDNGAA